MGPGGGPWTNGLIKSPHSWSAPWGAQGWTLGAGRWVGQSDHPLGSWGQGRVWNVPRRPCLARGWVLAASLAQSGRIVVEPAGNASSGGRFGRRGYGGEGREVGARRLQWQAVAGHEGWGVGRRRPTSGLGLEGPRRWRGRLRWESWGGGGGVQARKAFGTPRRLLRGAGGTALRVLGREAQRGPGVLAKGTVKSCSERWRPGRGAQPEPSGG